MEKLLLKYRNWHNSEPPKPIKLKIPGWAGEPNSHKTGDTPEPWHCVPFVEANTYGLELCYPFEAECHVYWKNDVLQFDGDFCKENAGITLPPFSAFAPGHFGMTSGLDIKVPEDYVLRLEPHPRFFTDNTNTTPCCIPGHLQTQWWTKIFFVVFKNPIKGQTIIFRKDEPYGQILIVPKKIAYEIKEMTNQEILERNEFDQIIENYGKTIANNDWNDHKGNNFNDKYKVLSAVYAKSGLKGLKIFINQIIENIKKNKPKLKHILIKRKHNEII